MITAHELHESQMSLEQTMTARMEEFERRLGSLSTSSKKMDLDELTRDYCSFKESVLPMLRLMQEQILSVATQVDEMDCRTRQNALLFSGIKEEDSEDPSVSICNTVVKLMGISDFNSGSIVQCVRLGAQRPDITRPILVRLANFATKSQLWNNKTRLKGSPVVIGEFLTKPRQRLFMRARRHFGVSSCWTRSGAVMVKLPDDSRVKVVTEAALDDLCKKHPAVIPKTKAKDAVRAASDKPVPNQPKVTPKGRTATAAATAPATRSKTAVSAASRDKR
ncbi:hypothetical protein JYU34_015603 [Plutella xylostella]|uniref:Uncharacterized protein n=1 Tax=Plutella xylostella TaxID=51655 RepID=A0ABQ7Q4K7_PLUXY|nr:hypothetical protein JYU34_015603 [Plutella xylostella]